MGSYNNALPSPPCQAKDRLATVYSYFYTTAVNEENQGKIV